MIKSIIIIKPLLNYTESIIQFLMQIINTK